MRNERQQDSDSPPVIQPIIEYRCCLCANCDHTSNSQEVDQQPSAGKALVAINLFHPCPCEVTDKLTKDPPNTCPPSTAQMMQPADAQSGGVKLKACKVRQLLCVHATSGVDRSIQTESTQCNDFRSSHFGC